METAKRLLIVEDEEATRMALCEHFALKGYAVDSASEWEEAEALLLAREYDVAITDLRLAGFGGMDGLEIVSFIAHRFPRMPTMVLTGFGSADLERETRRRGAAAFLYKPLPLIEIARAAESLMRDAA